MLLSIPLYLFPAGRTEGGTEKALASGRVMHSISQDQVDASGTRSPQIKSMANLSGIHPLKIIRHKP